MHANRPGHPAAPATLMKIQDIPQSGRCGTFVSVRTRYGQTRRRRGVIRKSPSPAQLLNRAIFGRIRALWRILTNAQRAAWAADTCATNSRSRLGQSSRLPAYLVFMKVNATLAFQGQAPVHSHPAGEARVGEISPLRPPPSSPLVSPFIKPAGTLGAPASSRHWSSEHSRQGRCRHPALPLTPPRRIPAKSPPLQSLLSLWICDFGVNYSPRTPYGRRPELFSKTIGES